MNSSPEMIYDLFVCLRLQDLRHHFFTHLSDCTHRKGIKTSGLYNDPTTPGLYKAIEVSKISVIVFSETFGASNMRLMEVITILKAKERFGQIVIPVFYDVDPLDVGNQTGRFGDGFAQQATDVRFQEWKDGLKKVSKFPGWRTGIMSDAEILLLVNEIARDVENKLLRLSRKKVIVEWSLVITNFILEIPSTVLGQISSTHKPSYTLAALLLSLFVFLLCLIDIVHKGITERVVWKTRPIPWFYYGTRRSKKMFGSFAEIFGLLCAFCQTILTAINYSFITRKVDAPIKFPVWPIIFAVGSLVTMYVKKKQI